ncbi:oligosaccharide flippase family protein [Massilia niabensis]|uniref:Oligosaccharide flippase family protein n=1 Tax=Massilia niabensis TaxID=544910 RepID=A0ABW0L9Q0_9BURK
MKKSLLNVFWLTAMQASNAALPLLVFPFALGAVGEHYYSKLVVSEALAVFLLAVVLYSFEIDGVAGVVGTDPKRDRARLSKLLCGIVITRLALFLIFLPVLAGVAWLLDPQLVLPALAWSLVPLSFAIQPNWFFQGLGQNAVVGAITVGARCSAAAATLLLVKDASSYMLVPLAIGVSYVIGAVLALAYAFVGNGLGWGWPGSTYLKKILINGRFIFFGNLGVTLYRDANVLILAAIGVPSAMIAAYSLAEKLVKSVQAAIRPLNQHFLPHAMRIARRTDVSRRSILQGLLRLTLPQMAALSALIGALYLAYPWAKGELAFVRAMGDLNQVVSLLGIMCIGALVGVANFMLGSAGLNAMGESVYLFRSIIVAGAVGVATCTFAGLYAGAYGAALAFVAAEVALQLAIINKYLQASEYELSWK